MSSYRLHVKPSDFRCRCKQPGGCAEPATQEDVLCNMCRESFARDETHIHVVMDDSKALVGFGKPEPS